MDFGRPSPASANPWRLRDTGASATAAVRAEEGETDGWSLRAASVVGVRHRLAGVGNDDAYGWSTGAGTLLVAVADGLGSVPGSAAASALAVAAATAAPTADPSVALQAAAAATAGGTGATTLVVAVLTPGRVDLARVGDSSAFVCGVDQEWAELWAAKEGEGQVVTATAALPAAEPRIETAGVDLGPDDILVLATDGVADPLRDGPTSVAPSLAAGLAARPGAIALAGLVDFSRQGCHDDRTLVAVWPS